MTRSLVSRHQLLSVNAIAVKSAFFRQERRIFYPCRRKNLFIERAVDQRAAVDCMLVGEVLSVAGADELRARIVSEDPCGECDGRAAGILGLASGVGCHLEAVAAQPHAAPTPGPFLACVAKVQHALPAFAHAIPV